MENRCVFCGDIIPEGRMVCPSCEQTLVWEKTEDRYDFENEYNKPPGIPILVTLLVSSLMLIGIACVGIRIISRMLIG